MADHLHNGALMRLDNVGRTYHMGEVWVEVLRSALFRGGLARLQSVSVGLLNDELAEPTDGLDEGELVVLAPESSLVDGARVRPVLSSPVTNGPRRDRPDGDT